MGILDGLNIPQESDPRITALKELLTGRPPERDTHSSYHRSAALILLNGLSRDYDIPEYKRLADLMASAWAGEDGWDRHTLVDALGRDRNAPTLPSQPVRLS